VKIFFKLLILSFAIFFILNTLRDVDLSLLFHTLKKLNLRDFVLVIFIVCLNFFLLTSYDALANRYFDFKMPLKKVYLAAFMVYGVSMNLGPLFGAVGLRLRLYKELGRTPLETTKIILFSAFSNWLGFFILLTFLFFFYPKNFSFLPFFQERNFVFLGIILWVFLIGIGLIFYFKGELKIRNIVFKVPGTFLVLKIILCSLMQWISQVYLLHFLIQKKTYLQLMAIYFLSSLGSLVSHIPGGVGIFESLVIQGMSIEKDQALIGLILFRGMYFFFPGMIAGFLIFIKSILTRENT